MDYPQAIQHDPDLPELEYAVHCAWAEAYGLKDLMRKATPDEIAACRKELRETRDMLSALLGGLQ